MNWENQNCRTNHWRIHFSICDWTCPSAFGDLARQEIKFGKRNGNGRIPFPSLANAPESFHQRRDLADRFDVHLLLLFDRKTCASFHFGDYFVVGYRYFYRRDPGHDCDSGTLQEKDFQDFRRAPKTSQRSRKTDRRKTQIERSCCC